MAGQNKTANTLKDPKDPTKLYADAALLAAQPHIAVLMNAIPQMAMILNTRCQVVCANDSLVRVLGAGVVCLGGRIGELLGCIHCRAREGGCGSREACQVCGAVQAIVDCQQTHQPVTKECRMTVVQGGHEQALDLRVDAAPIMVDGEEFTVVTATDISDQKRRKILEHVFFHDLVNVAGGLNGYVRYLMEADDRSVIQGGLADTLRMSEDILEQITSQRELLAAEGGDLIVTPGQVLALQLLKNTGIQISHHAAAIGRTIEMDPDSREIEFVSDLRALRRVLVNMLKNAVEASPRGAKVKAGCALDSGKVRFWVQNPGVIPRPIQLQIFQRSFSTRGPTRGLGSYSMKLLSERYLGGTVGFISNETVGTIFHVELPLALPVPAIPTAARE